VLFVVDGLAGMGNRDRELYQSIREKRHLVVVNKRDLVTDGQLAALAQEFSGAAVLMISARHHRESRSWRKPCIGRSSPKKVNFQSS
jgi:predicted GTPase